MFVFMLTGLWHGAQWTFVIWGLWNGLFIVLERVVKLKFKIPVFIKHCYLIAVVCLVFVCFRADSFGQLKYFLYNMSGFNGFDLNNMRVNFDNAFIAAFAAGIVFSMPVLKYLKGKNIKAVNAVSLAPVCVLMFVVAFKVIMSAYSPFLYFRF